MPSVIKDLPSLIPTSSGSPNTNAVGHLDDASVIGIFLNSTMAGDVVTAGNIQVCQFDPADPFPVSAGVTESSAFFKNLSTSVGNVIVTTSGQAIYLSPIFFRGFRLSGLTSAVAADVTAFCTKQISV
jgi:hypothetical protein